MIEIPEEILKAISIKQGTTYYFVHTEISDKPHYFIIMNRSSNGILVYLVNTTTNMDGRENYRKLRGFPTETIVYIPKGTIEFLPKDCCIDCNNVLKDSKDDFIRRIKGADCWELPKK